MRSGPRPRRNSLRINDLQREKKDEKSLAPWGKSLIFPYERNHVTLAQNAGFEAWTEKFINRTVVRVKNKEGKILTFSFYSQLASFLKQNA